MFGTFCDCVRAGFCDFLTGVISPKRLMTSMAAKKRRTLMLSPVSVEKSRFTTRFSVPTSLLVIRFFLFFRPGSCSCNLWGWFTAQESHQPFQVLRRGRQIELVAHEAHPAQPQST